MFTFKFRTLTILIFLFSFLLIGCEKSKSEAGSYFGASTLFYKSEITIGTFNLEWMGDGYNDRIDRTEKDFKNYASVIENLDADLLGVQEVENDNALRRITKYLPDYSYYIGSEGGAQKIALIYKKKLKVNYVEEYTPLMINPGRTKPGVLFKVNINNFDFYLMVVHLKSSSHWDNTPEKIKNSFGTRELQAEILANWADSVQNLRIEEDLIIIGDFNDSPKRKKNNTLYPLMNLKFVTENLKSCRFKNSFTIDHIVTSKSASERIIPESEFMMDLASTFTKEDVKTLSDHCPVVVKFDTKKADNDPPGKSAKK